MILMGDRKKQITQILGPRDGEQEGSSDGALHACVSEFLDAVHAHDVDGACAALKACFAELEATPHVEE